MALNSDISRASIVSVIILSFFFSIFSFLFHWQPAVLNIVEQVKLRVKVDKMFTCHRRHNVNLDYKIVKLQVNFLS
jgi:poly(A) polymerase Pap1